MKNFRYSITYRVFSTKISESYNIKKLEIDKNDGYILNHLSR